MTLSEIVAAHPTLDNEEVFDLFGQDQGYHIRWRDLSCSLLTWFDLVINNARAVL